MPHEPCLLCNKTLEPFLLCKDHIVSHEEFPVSLCESCEFMQTENAPKTVDEAEKYYAVRTYVCHQDNPSALLEKIARFVQAHITHPCRRKLIERWSGTKSGSLVEIGCGVGTFLRYMKKFNWSVIGTDSSETARDACKAIGIDASDNDVLAEIPSDSIDCVVLWHVLEHLQDPHGILEEVHRILAPNGMCITAVPNAFSYNRSQYGTRWYGFDVPRHLWHFSPKSLESIFTMHKLKEVKRGSMFLDTAYVSLRSEKPTLFGRVRALGRSCIAYVISLWNPSTDTCVYGIYKKVQEHSA